MFLEVAPINDFVRKTIYPVVFVYRKVFILVYFIGLGFQFIGFHSLGNPSFMMDQ